MKARLTRGTGSLLPLLLVGVFLGVSGGREPSAAAAPVSKDSPEYKRALDLFKDGIKDFDGGYYTRAIEKFKAALKLYPSPKIHTRIALCYKWLGDYLKALEHYELFLEQLDEPKTEADRALKKSVAENEIPKLLAMVAQVRVVMENPPGAEIRIDGRLVGESPMDKVFRLKPGAINVSSSKKGYYGFKRDLMVDKDQKATVRIKLVKIKPKVIKKVVTVKETPIYKRWWFWTAIGAVVAGGAAAVGATLGTQENPRSPSGLPIRHDSLTLRW